MLSGRGLCDDLITRPEESYRLWCVVACDLETSRMGAPYIYDISRLRVNVVTEDTLTVLTVSGFCDFNECGKEIKEMTFTSNYKSHCKDDYYHNTVCIPISK